MAGFANDVLIADNVNFTGATGVPGKIGTVTTDGQLLIGSTATPNIQVGTLTSPNNTITIGYSSPNITLQSGSIVANNFPTDDGTAIPSLGVLKILGSSSTDYTQSGLVTHSDGTSNEIYLENRLYTTKFVVDATTTVGSRGSYSTIQSAITAAASATPAVVYIRPGTYTENLTMSPGVSLVAASTVQASSTVTIVGKMTFTSAGTYLLNNINFQTNSDYIVEMTGSAALSVRFSGCTLTGTNNTLINFTNSSASSGLSFYNCVTDLQTTGITQFIFSGSGNITFDKCTCNNSGSTTTSTTHSGGVVNIKFSEIGFPYTNSGSTAALGAQYSGFNTNAINTTCLTIGSTGDTDTANFCTFGSGTASAISVGAGATLTLQGATINTSNTNAITGSGAILYGGIVFQNSQTVNTTTKTQKKFFPKVAPTIQTFTSGSSATYTTPANCQWIRVRMVGGGGGGEGSGTGGGVGGAGGDTTWSGGSLTAGGSPGGTYNSVGGTASGGNVANFSGQPGNPRSSNGANVFGGNGGSSVFGGEGKGGDNIPTAGYAAATNTGSGGGGAGCGATLFAGSGGGSGGYVEHIINSPAATYTYTVGAGGTAGAAGTGGVAGGAGAAGYIIVEEYYL